MFLEYWLKNNGKYEMSLLKNYSTDIQNIAYFKFQKVIINSWTKQFLENADKIKIISSTVTSNSENKIYLLLLFLHFGYWKIQPSVTEMVG